jgi:hypothetical protein
MNYEDIKTKFLNKKFIFYYVVIFIILYLFCSFINFVGQLPILLIITFLIVYYLNYNKTEPTIIENNNIKI